MKPVLLLSALVLAAPSAFSLTPFDLAKPPAAKAPAKCANFTGEWDAACTMNGKPISTGSEKWRLGQIGCHTLKLFQGTEVNDIVLNVTKTIQAVSPEVYGPGIFTWVMSMQWQNNNQDLGFTNLVFKTDQIIEASEGSYRWEGPKKVIFRNTNKNSVWECALTK